MIFFQHVKRSLRNKLKIQLHESYKEYEYFFKQCIKLYILKEIEIGNSECFGSLPIEFRSNFTGIFFPEFVTAVSPKPACSVSYGGTEVLKNNKPKFSFLFKHFEEFQIWLLILIHISLHIIFDFLFVIWQKTLKTLY